MSDQQLALFRGANDDLTTLFDGADELLGNDLVDQGDLEGVPFLVTKVTFRDGIKKDAKPTNYVSFEAIVYPEPQFTQRVGERKLLRVAPGQPIVFNDGSTGACRQITQYLHLKGLIDVGQVGRDVGGAMGTSPFDRYRLDWIKGGDLTECSFEVKLRCPRGLRRSEYTAQATGTDAVTWYLG